MFLDITQYLDSTSCILLDNNVISYHIRNAVEDDLGIEGGHNLFLGIGQIGAEVGKNTGPFTELPGENKDKPITSFNLIITTDKNGNFTGVNVGGKNYSIENWNKQVLNTDPQKKKQ